jgi:hypothetical protein
MNFKELLEKKCLLCYSAVVIFLTLPKQRQCLYFHYYPSKSREVFIEDKSRPYIEHSDWTLVL